MKSILFIMNSIVAVSAIISGILMVIVPDGSLLALSTGLLYETPFQNFLVPGILLCAVVGGVNMIAVIFILRNHPSRYNWAIAGGIVSGGWMLVEFIMISDVHWLQGVYMFGSVMIVLAAYQLKGKWAV
ncbi:MAG: hypothetical protein IPP93_08680 [Chitinophagaceae bacterium]|nr:hypothetical protein [Chitinophagaceae bacterium]MBL0337480.1 hypothetical protein [Chitinophagaceae bacterium]